MPKTKSKLSFTLIELLVVIAIVGILAGLIILTMSDATEQARIAKLKVYSNSARDVNSQNLISEWKFDDITDYDINTKIINSNSNNIPDSWGSSHGTSHNGPILKDGADCVSGKCISFNGIDNYISIASLPYQTIHGPSAFELWIKPSSFSVNQRPFSDNCQEWGLRIVSGSLRAIVYTSVLGTNLSLDKWYHIIVSHSHPTGLTGTKIALYNNGIKENEITIDIVAQNGYYDPLFYFGTDICNASTYFAGTMDEIRYYKDGLSISQIRSNYLAGLDKLLVNGGITQGEYDQRIAELNNSVAKE